MITVTTTSTQELLSTVGDLKIQLELNDSSKDALLTGLLHSASERIQKEIGRPVLKQSYTETIRTFGQIDMLVSRRPILEVFSIWRGSSSGGALSSDEFSIEDAEGGIIYGPSGWAWDAGFSQFLDASPIRGMERPSYTVTYDAGWVYPGTTDEGRTLPYSVEQATLELAKHYYQNRKTNANVSEKKIGDVSVRYGSQSGGITKSDSLPSSVMILLQPYLSLTG